jgi:hypothetical protein
LTLLARLSASVACRRALANHCGHKRPINKHAHARAHSEHPPGVLRAATVCGLMERGGSWRATRVCAVVAMCARSPCAVGSSSCSAASSAQPSRSPTAVYACAKARKRQKQGEGVVSACARSWGVQCCLFERQPSPRAPPHAHGPKGMGHAPCSGGRERSLGPAGGADACKPALHHWRAAAGESGGEARVHRYEEHQKSRHILSKWSTGEARFHGKGGERGRSRREE